MKRRDNKGLVGAPSADLLVCFPSRAHLTLMPKPICSPARPSDSNKRHHHLKRITTRPGSAAGGGGPPSPLLWANNKQVEGRARGGHRGSELSSEPTSPKVTCAGQIKVRPSASGAACRNWQSVMEEIERIHNRSKLQRQKKAKSSWVQPLGFKKDVMNFLTCLRNIRFDFRCFGSFPEPDITSDDEDEDEEAEDDDDDQEYLEAAEDQKSDDQGNNNNDNNNNNTSAVFSKWFMVLQDNSQLQSNSKIDGQVDSDNAAAVPAVPPPNALVLMRCRSAPAKSWLEDKENRDRVIANAKKRETDNGKDQDKGEEEEEKEKQLLSLSAVEEEEKHCKKKRRESLAILMKYDTDFYNMSSDVAQETWVVGGVRGGAAAGAAARGGLKDPFSRSRSWRR